MTEDRPTQDRELLSDTGLVRRDEMLTELLTDLGRVRRRRRIRRGVLSTTAATLLIVTIARIATFDPGASPAARDRMAIKVPSTDETSRVSRVTTDESIVQRMRPEPIPMVVRINDEQLLQTLVHIGRPAGLIRIGDRLALSAPVTDDELARERNR